MSLYSPMDVLYMSLYSPMDVLYMSLYSPMDVLYRALYSPMDVRTCVNPHMQIFSKKPEECPHQC